MKTPSALTLAVLLSLLPLPVGGYTILPLRHCFDITHNFLQPTDVAVGKDHQIYLLDGVNNRVQVFDQQGNFTASFGGAGSGPGKFNLPLGIATDSSGRVYVADTGNRRVQIFSPGGRFERQIALSPGKGGKQREPVDVAVAEQLGQIYVTDNENHQVLVFSQQEGTLTATWGSEGLRDGQFHYPFFITAGRDGTAYVVDVLNTRVQVWQAGKPRQSIGSWGVDLGQFYRPKGVTLDTRGMVLVSDSVLGVIQTFTPEGTFQAVLGTEKGEVMTWETPVGITIDSRQRLYVVEMITNRVRVYDLLTDMMLEKQYTP